MILGRVAADEAEILTLAVDPTYAAAAWDRRCCVRRWIAPPVWARLDVPGGRGDQPRGAALYDAHGFTEAGLRRHYYTDGTDALILRSTLSAGSANS